MSKISLKKKGKMYECTTFFPSGFPKKWKYVRDLKSFTQFLSKDHASWKYFNVYEKGTKNYLKRFYPGNVVPKTLGLLLLVLLTQKFTSSNTFSNSEAYIMKNTTSNKTTSSTYNTSINGFINSTTISNHSDKKSILC